MKTQKYDKRLPALRASIEVVKGIKEYAQQHHITQAEAHRLLLGQALRQTNNFKTVLSNATE